MQRHRFRFIIIALTLAAFLQDAPPVCAEKFTQGQPVAPFTPQFQPGDYVWHPEISPAGPVVIIVSLPEQVLYVYRNGVRIGRSSISSGRPGHHTPTGVFTILEKHEKHVSTIYKGASMPYMERVTWGGVALHAGDLPGYPASHGCVRLPLDFAQKLYTVTSNGTTVIITDNKSAPGSTSAPGLLFTATPGETAPPGTIVWNPDKAPVGPISIIISTADREASVYRDGIEIGCSPVGGLPGIAGSYVYSALATVDSKGLHDWLSTASIGGTPPNVKALVKSVQVDTQFLANTRALVTPGANLILTDTPVSVSTRSGTGFNILTTAAIP